MLDDFNIIITSPYLPTNAVFKAHMLFWIRVIFLWDPLGQCSVFLQGQYPNKTWSTAWKVAPGPLKECSVHFQMCSPRFKGAMPPLEKPIFFAQYLQYYWQRASLSKVQYVWTSEHYWRTLLCFLPQSNIILSCMAKNLTWFSNRTTGPTQTIKSSESTFATPKVGELAKS